MKEYTLEVCVDSVESAIAAKQGGALRLELCSNLIIGGTTPGTGLFHLVRRAADLKIHVLIRPRFGDFCYTDYELELMCEDIRLFRELGADGVVIGALNPDGTLNIRAMKAMISEAGQMHVTMHRAFDVCKDPLQTLEECVTLGVGTILTSGQEENCMKGIALLKELKARAGGRIHILAGAGVHTGNIETLHVVSGITQFHMSGKQVLDSCMEYRKEGVPMGLPGISEYSIWRTDEAEIQKAADILRRI